MTTERIWEVLRGIPDPEIPALSLVDLNVVRLVEVDGDGIRIELRPTFSGCPALELMRAQVAETLKGLTSGAVRVTVQHSSSWTTEDLTDETRKKLENFGIAPPPRGAANLEEALSLPVVCPHCHSADTRLDSPFGTTLCKQLYVCRACRQPFERFKPL